MTVEILGTLNFQQVAQAVARLQLSPQGYVPFQQAVTEEDLPEFQQVFVGFLGSSQPKAWFLIFLAHHQRL